MSRLAVVASTGEFGGAEATDIHYLRALCDAGIEVHVALPAEGALRRRLEPIGVHCHLVASPDALNTLSRRYVSKGASPIALLGGSSRYELRLAQWLRLLRPAGCLATGFRAQLALAPVAAMLRLPLGWVASDFVPVEPLLCRVWAQAARLPRVVIAYSRAAAAQPALRHARKVRVVLSGIDLARYPAGPANRAPLILLVGHLTPLKNHLGFLDLMRGVLGDVPGARGLIAGGDIYRTAAHAGYGERVRHAVATFEPPGRVRLVAAQPDEVPALMREAAVLTQISGAPETFGLVCAEAMASGCAVVAFDRGALPEVVGDAGRLVPPDDLDAAAAACSSLLRDDGLRRSLAARGRERVEREFSATRAGQEGATAIAEALAL